MRSAPSARRRLTGLAAAGLAALAAALGAPSPAAAAAGADEAEIILRKSFRPPGGEAPGRAATGGRSGTEGAAPPDPALAARGPAPNPAAAAALAGIAAALGEPLASGGSLHLPDVAGRDLTLDTALTPLVETAGGRRLIVDAAGAIPPETAAAVAARWPSYAVVAPDPGGGTRGLLAAILREAGYASVAADAPIRFGREATVRIRPDHVVLRREGDLLDGETRALSVVDDAAEAIPEELREMAAAHRVLVLEVVDGGDRPIGRGPWRDPRAPVTTVAGASPAFVLGELAAALGAAPPGGLLDDLAGAPLPLAVGELLAELGVPAIGPAVELSRPVGPGRRRRFTITVPGWLAEAGGRRLLVTGAELPPPLRLFLAREGIAVFEYRAR